MLLLEPNVALVRCCGVICCWILLASAFSVVFSLVEVAAEP